MSTNSITVRNIPDSKRKIDILVVQHLYNLLPLLIIIVTTVHILSWGAPELCVTVLLSSHLSIHYSLSYHVPGMVYYTVQTLN